jgi:hypothetical protein
MICRKEIDPHERLARAVGEVLGLDVAEALRRELREAVRQNAQGNPGPLAHLSGMTVSLDGILRDVLALTNKPDTPSDPPNPEVFAPGGKFPRKSSSYQLPSAGTSSSSFIHWAVYDPQRESLALLLRAQYYLYFGVPEEVVANLGMYSGTIGRWYTRSIKGKFPSARVEYADVMRYWEE